MSIVDILIIVFIITGALVGFKQGFTKSLISFIGVVAIIIVSFTFKNVVSDVFMRIFPFFPFGGLIKGVTVLNIVLYEALSFAFVFSILMVVLKIIEKTTSIFEKFLSFTIILGIPSKILGLVVGLIKNYVIVFFVVYFLAMPNFSEVSIVNDSKFRDPILRNTPVLSIFADNAVKVLDEFSNLSKKSTPLDEIEYKENFVLVLGNESRGISQEVRKLADLEVIIPISNIDSLNVSVAGGILMNKIH